MPLRCAIKFSLALSAIVQRMTSFSSIFAPLIEGLAIIFSCNKLVVVIVFPKKKSHSSDSFWFGSRDFVLPCNHVLLELSCQGQAREFLAPVNNLIGGSCVGKMGNPPLNRQRIPPVRRCRETTARSLRRPRPPSSDPRCGGRPGGI